ncbi:MAG: hypothetical protein WC476_08800 [Phycisphaerae bacterium]|jgi:hypothetical protein
MTNLPAESLDLNEEKRTAEDYLIHYAFYKEQLEAQRLDIIEGRPSQDEIPPREKFAHGNPTLNKAGKLLSEKQMQTDCWLRAAEATRKHFDGQANTNHREYIKMRYEEGKTPRTIESELGVSRATVFNIRDEVLNYMAFAHVVFKNANIFLRGYEVERNEEIMEQS